MAFVPRILRFTDFDDLIIAALACNFRSPAAECRDDLQSQTDIFLLLLQVGLHVNDLFTDLADGKILLKLLEIISGEKIGKPNVGKIRVQKIENLNKSLHYLATKVVGAINVFYII